MIETTMVLQDRSLEARLPQVGTLIMGDSHAQGIHYALFDDALHIASPGESLIETYYRLARILERRPPRLRRVVVSLGVHSLLETKRAIYDAPYWVRVVDFRDLAARSPEPWKVIQTAAIGEIGFVGEGIAIWTDLRDAYRRWLRGRPRRSWEDRLRRWDEPPSTPDLSQRSAAEIEALTRRTVRAHVALGARFDPFVAGYLDRTLALARDAGLELLLVETPVTRAYLEQMRGLTDVAAHDRFVAEAVARHGADLLDLRSAFDDPALFTDPEHVSPVGRAEVTRRVRQRLESAPQQDGPGARRPGRGANALRAPATR